MNGKSSMRMGGHNNRKPYRMKRFPDYKKAYVKLGPGRADAPSPSKVTRPPCLPRQEHRSSRCIICLLTRLKLNDAKNSHPVLAAQEELGEWEGFIIPTPQSVPPFQPLRADAVDKFKKNQESHWYNRLKARVPHEEQDDGGAATHSRGLRNQAGQVSVS